MYVFGFFRSSRNDCREGVNREKLTVKKLIENEMFYCHRLCPLQTVKNRRKPWKNRHQTVKKSAPKIHHFSPLVFHRLRLLEIDLKQVGVDPLDFCRSWGRRPRETFCRLSWGISGPDLMDSGESWDMWKIWCFPMEPLYEINPGVLASKTGNQQRFIAMNSAQLHLITLN